MQSKINEYMAHDIRGLSSHQEYREKRELTRSGSKHSDMDNYRGEKPGYPGAVPMPALHSRGSSAAPSNHQARAPAPPMPNGPYKHRVRSMYNFDAAGPGEISRKS
jgi:hypothetical protein